MTSFLLKIIGIISMICDHSSDAIIGNFSNLNLIGRFAFPIFAFQAANGYTHTRNLKNYMIRLLIFAIISQIPFMLFISTYSNNFSLNIFFTLLLGICSLYFYDKINNKILGFAAVIAISIIAQLIKVDYGAFGVLSVFLFYLFKDDKLKMLITFLLLCIGKYTIYTIQAPILYEYYIKLGVFTFFAIIPILFFNNKQGPKLKYFFYVFYPLHLIILWAIHMFFLKG